VGNTTAENKESGKLFSIIIPVFREKENINNCLSSIFISYRGFMGTLRSWIPRIPFGDQVHFIKRETFFKIGGYQDIPRTINESLISLFDFTY